jgi:S-adenosylmethionine-diacylglycerol 3-amino-3-carboxypropyl transferase
MGSGIETRADFSRVRYGQCWEDADVLLEALDPQPGHACLSIASAGDNTLALLARGPERVVAIDLSPAQLYCLELRVAAFGELAHAELLELIGSRPSRRRQQLYRRCRSQLSPDGREFWDCRSGEIDAGIGGAGKFERYFALFRQRVLPLVHSQKKVERLLDGSSAEERARFYDDEWDTRAWRGMFRLFFSRLVMGWLGRDRSFFRYVEGSVADRLLERARFALTQLDPRENPYLQWILTGRHATALPFALREENFEAIRAGLDRLEWRCASLEDFLQTAERFDRFNLSDVFEYVSIESYHRLLRLLVKASRRGARLAYWNMLAPRQRPDQMAEALQPLHRLSARLHKKDRAFFYSAFVVEESLT